MPSITTRFYVFFLFIFLVNCLHSGGAVTKRPHVQDRLKRRPTAPTGCSKNEFTCGDKQCIPISAVCNGTSECSNGKDESEEQCAIISTGMCTTPRKSTDLCASASSLNTSHQSANISQFLCQTESLLKNNSVPLACLNNFWTPSNALCTRICQPIVLPSENMTCTRNGKKVNCSQPLLIGTKIYPQCEFYYKPSHKEIACQANGEWSEKRIECIAECGRQFKDKMRYTRSMRSAEYREFPWNVAIYYTKPGTTSPILIPGTIITPYLILTTAINFYSDFHEGLLNVEAVTVVVAKRTKEFEATDDQFQKYYKIRDIYFTDTGYQNNELSMTSDNVAIVELNEKIVLSPSVYPACVNWGKNVSLSPEEGTIGQVPHTLTIYEANSSATLQHEILQTVALRYVNRYQCLSTDILKSIPHVVKLDNFCGEPISAPAPCDGAFIFKEMNTNLFYIQGLVDGVTPSVEVPPTFTNTFLDLDSHIDWMNEVRKHTEDQLVVNEVLIQTEPTDPVAICQKNNVQEDRAGINTRSAFGNDEEQNQKNATEGCFLPTKNSLNANNYAVSCPVDSSLKKDCSKIKENGTAPEFTALKLMCKDNYALDSSEEFVCFKGKWSPTLNPCQKICQKLPKLENGKFNCFNGEAETNCSGKLKVGTKLEPHCDQLLFKLEWQSESQEIKCDENGKWSSSLPKCVKKSGHNQRKPSSPPFILTTRFDGEIGNGKESENVTCSKEAIPCGKTCVPKTAFCNGTVECDDGRDESPEFCKILSTKSCSGAQKLGNYCDQQKTTDSGVHNRNSSKATKTFSFLCQVDETNTGVPLTCIKEVAIPSKLPCKKICQNISLTISGLECFLNDKRVDCKKPLLVGTALVPHCETGYKPNHENIKCNENGEWNHDIVECIPECGNSTRNNTKMTRSIRPAQFREFPWNVAIYKKTTDPPVLFAGIIISPQMILTNAKCCINEMNAGQATDKFEVVVGKRSADMETEDDDYQKTVRVKNVHFPEKLVEGLESIAIIELVDQITMCPAVHPACVNWNRNASLNPKDGTLGLVPHWRTRNKDNSDTTHEMLQTIALSLLNRESCQRRIGRNFLKYLTKDAFCVDPLPLLTPAHRGAGFIYEDNASKLHYLQGIIYFTGTEYGQTTMFTNMFLNITPHMDWINSVRHKTEKRLHRDLVLNNRITKDNEVCKKQDPEEDLDPRINTDVNNRPDDFLSNGCELPVKDWQYLDYVVNCLPTRHEDKCQKAEAGTVVPEFASLSLTCNEGYVSNGYSEVICFRNKWSPAIEPCRKICDKLLLKNVNVKCFWLGKRVDCNDVLKSGTTAVVECAPNYQSLKSLPKLECDEYGHWNGVNSIACSHFDPWSEQGEKDIFFNYTLQL